MTLILSIKRGSTFRYRMPLPADLRDAAFQAQVRAMGSGALVSDLTIRVIDVDALCLLELEADDTSEWPISNLSADVEARLGNEVVHSETIQIKVLRNVTV